MTDIPIIFSAPMVLAMLAGRKTMTRRLALAKPSERTPVRRSSPWTRVEPGDRLWVRETALYWLDRTNKKTKVAAYKADGYQLEPGEQWSPSIHMPRAFSRLTLIVTATKIDWLQEISAGDAMAEGVEDMDGHKRNFGVRGPGGGWLGTTFSSAPEAFKYLWMSLHGAGSWNENPEVVAISFRVIKANIDAEEARAA